MNGLVVRVLHPDFIENADDQRRGFIEGVLGSWGAIQEAWGLDRGETVHSMTIYERKKAVEVFISYGAGVRWAEMEAAGFIAAGSQAVVHLNIDRMPQNGAEIMAAYSYVIERDVEEAAFKGRPGSDGVVQKKKETVHGQPETA